MRIRCESLTCISEFYVRYYKCLEMMAMMSMKF